MEKSREKFPAKNTKLFQSLVKTEGSLAENMRSNERAHNNKTGVDGPKTDGDHYHKNGVDGGKFNTGKTLVGSTTSA